MRSALRDFLAIGVGLVNDWLQCALVFRFSLGNEPQIHSEKTSTIERDQVAKRNLKRFTVCDP